MLVFFFNGFKFQNTTNKLSFPGISTIIKYNLYPNSIAKLNLNYIEWYFNFWPGVDSKKRHHDPKLETSSDMSVRHSAHWHNGQMVMEPEYKNIPDPTFTKKNDVFETVENPKLCWIVNVLC